MNRQTLLGVAIASFAICASAQVEASTPDTVPLEKPNILFCIADDWSWPHASAYGDPVVKTPVFDRIARDGVLFTNAYCASPSCTPSRAGILTGQAIHRLREGASLHGFLPEEFAVYPDLLEQSEYRIGHSGKAWGPGRFKRGGRKRNPAGPRFKSFEAFIEAAGDASPFCFWLGSSDPHRPYAKGSGVAAGMKIADVIVPGFLPDTDVVRSDILDYYVEVQRFDALVGRALALLEKTGRLANTIVVMTSDNGMPFPRAKATLYDGGTRMPLAIMWKKRVKGSRESRAFTSATDFAPTFLEAAAVVRPPSMTGQSLMPLLATNDESQRERVFLERERHAHVREGNVGYPSRAIRTEDFLLVWNLRANRWPSGNPQHVFSVGAYGDVDNSPTKSAILAKRDRFFELAFAKRPEFELYDLRKDPAQTRNVAGDATYAERQNVLREALERWMRTTADPRADDEDVFDAYPYSAVGHESADSDTWRTRDTRSSGSFEARATKPQERSIRFVSFTPSAPAPFTPSAPAPFTPSAPAPRARRVPAGPRPDALASADRQSERPTRGRRGETRRTGPRVRVTTAGIRRQSVLGLRRVHSGVAVAQDELVCRHAKGCPPPLATRSTAGHPFVSDYALRPT